MKKFWLFLCTVILVLSFSGTAGAGLYTFEPSDYAYLNTLDPNDKAPDDLWDLTHQKYYTWGIDLLVPDGETIIGASLFFDDICNWDRNDNNLYANLLPGADKGVSVGDDNQGGGNYFALDPDNHLLFDWTLGTDADDMTYPFDSDDLDFLQSAILLDGNFGLGFDPDCHYWNDGIKLTIETAPVPEPATMLLLGFGLVGLAGFRRKFRKG